ncbi:MAG: hypothetical protein CMF26_03420 [Kiloniella sp.]|nr:hypothetical protein [Kiloniella sp.]
MIGTLRRLLGRKAEPHATTPRNPIGRRQGQARLTAIKAVALQPVLFAQWGIPDRFDGRFEAVLLLTAVDFARLVRAEDTAAADALLTAFMEDVELALQASGVSDSGMRKKMRQVETSAYARVARIGVALRQNAPSQPEILNSMFGGSEDAAPRATADRLDSLLHALYADPDGLASADALIARLS